MIITIFCISVFLYFFWFYVEHSEIGISVIERTEKYKKTHFCNAVRDSLWFYELQKFDVLMWNFKFLNLDMKTEFVSLEVM